MVLVTEVPMFAPITTNMAGLIGMTEIYKLVDIAFEAHFIYKF